MRENQEKRRAGITGIGSSLPDRLMTNEDLEKLVDTSDEWIRTRTGIRERHVAGDDVATSDMCAAAARNAMEMAGVEAEEIEMIIVGTITPDMPFPNTACFVQSLIGAKNAFCYDVEAACSGFLYGLQIARLFIEQGEITTALVIGGEKLSCITDWEDRSTCVLFGDGAGAAIVQPKEKGKGILSCVMGSDGTLAELLNMPGGGSRHPASPETVKKRMHYMKMTGNEVFKHAVRCMCDAGQQALDKAGLSIDDVDWVIPHQANLRIIQAVSNRLKKSMDDFCVNLDHVGNMSAASVPVALDEAVRSGRIKKGDTLLFIVFGGGFTWGAMTLEW